MQTRKQDVARVTLAGIRLANGVIGLFAPQIIMGRFRRDADTPDAPVATYALRMFGIRTILVALDLLRGDGPVRSHAMRVAPLIHASDLCTAILIARSGKVKPQTGALIVAISAWNTLLSLIIARNSANAGETVA
jgi:hypothetical protein